MVSAMQIEQHNAKAVDFPLPKIFFCKICLTAFEVGEAGVVSIFFMGLVGVEGPRFGVVEVDLGSPPEGCAFTCSIIFFDRCAGERGSEMGEFWGELSGELGLSCKERSESHDRFYLRFLKRRRIW